MFQSSTISLKNVPPLAKKPSCNLFRRNNIEGNVLLTKIKSAASLESYTVIWKYVTILSITPFLWKYVTLLSKNSSCALLGQENHLFEGTVSFSKNIILHPQRLRTWKGKLHIPKEYCACLAYFFLSNDFTKMAWGQDESDLVWINLD